MEHMEAQMQARYEGYEQERREAGHRVMFTDAHKQKITAAVRALNDTIAEIHDECGEAVEVRPYVNYDVDSPPAAVAVQITTGRILIG